MKQLKIAGPQGLGSEFSYVASIILETFLGISWTFEPKDTEGIVVSVPGYSGSIELGTDFFDQLSRHGVDSVCLPELPLQSCNPMGVGLNCDLVDKELPVIYGNSKIEVQQRHIILELDIFGSVFFMLSRFEELVKTDRDQHDRFPASASLAFRAHFLERPIVDEYVEVLWSAMNLLWPHLERRAITGRVLLSCDVDYPFDRTRLNKKNLLRVVIADIMVRRNMSLAYKRILNYFRSQEDDYTSDPYYTFDWYLSLCEQHDLCATFYFISAHSGGDIDGDYDINDHAILELMDKIVNKGHGIGVHGSYNSYRDVGQLRVERDNILSALSRIQLTPNVRETRQHYLRWDVSCTADILDQMNYQVDATGAYATHAGFRYGTSKVFHMWSWQTMRRLDLLQQPLVVMDASIVLKANMGLGYGQAAYEKITLLKHRALRYGGNFSILWHNTSLLNRKSKRLLSAVVI